jgi:uncharacterized membrane protein
MECVDAGEAARFAHTGRRHNSLTSSGRLLVFGSILAVSLGIALAFTMLHGAWPLLPFAGAEMVGLFLAFRHIERHAGDCERVTIGAGRLIVEVFDGSRRQRHEFSSYWARLIVANEKSQCRLAIRSHGREVEVGRHLDTGGRRALAQTLRRELPGG